MSEFTLRPLVAIFRLFLNLCQVCIRFEFLVGLAFAKKLDWANCCFFIWIIILNNFWLFKLVQPCQTSRANFQVANYFTAVFIVVQLTRSLKTSAVRVCLPLLSAFWGNFTWVAKIIEQIKATDKIRMLVYLKKTNDLVSDAHLNNVHPAATFHMQCNI